MVDRLRRPTMNDVARSAGVSLKSVSRVINDEVGASPETRDRVLRAARSLGYRRNDAAHALRRSDGRSASVGLVLEDIEQSVRVGAQPRGRGGGERAGQPGPRGQHERRPGPRGVPGLPASRPRRGRAGDHVVPSGPPVPAARDSTAGCPSCSSTGRRAGWPAARSGSPTARVRTTRTAHLIAHGHRRIAFLGDRPSLYTADERHARLPARAAGRRHRRLTRRCNGVVGRTPAKRPPGCRRMLELDGSADRRVRRAESDRRRRAGRAASGDGCTGGSRWSASTTSTWPRWWTRRSR